MSPSEFMRAYEAASGSHDLAATLELIDDDAVYWFSNETAHHGKAAIADAIRENFDAIENEVYRIASLTWLAESDDLACGIFTFSWTGEIEGVTRSGAGRGSVVLKRHGTTWRVLHEHLSHGRLAQ